MTDSATTAAPAYSRTKRSVLLIVAALLAYAAVDLFGPRTSDLRQFEPLEVARLETSMWRAYYDRRPVALFGDLSQLMRTQYHFPWLRSQVAAYHAARAAFLFKGGHSRAEYERALPSLLSFYAAIRKVSNTPFDASQAARLELEWWIVHRQTRAEGPQALWKALADLQACIYGVPAERMIEHARARGDAMLLRDREADRGGVSEEQWREIRRLLEASWTSLWNAVKV